VREATSKTEERGALGATPPFEAAAGSHRWPQPAVRPGGDQWPPLTTPPVLIRTLDVEAPLMAAFSA
jgi:hypothetical protein